MDFLSLALPEPFTSMRFLIDITPIIPVLLFLFAFLWQATVGFK